MDSDSQAAASADGATVPEAAAGGAARGGNASSSGASPGGLAKCFVIVYNVSKKHNIGTLLRSCTAFGVTQVCLVGSRHFNTFGSHGSAEHVDLRHFPTIEACCTWLRDEQGCRILGVEIDAAAQPVQSHPFSGNAAFMLGNEGQGLSEKQLRLCDGFVYIPQHGAGTASLNVTVAASIVLHHFAIWAGYGEAGRQGAKFVVAERPPRTQPRGVVPLSEEERAALRAARAAGSGGGAKGGAEWLAAAMEGGGGLEGLLEAVAAGEAVAGGQQAGAAAATGAV